MRYLLLILFSVSIYGENSKILCELDGTYSVTYKDIKKVHRVLGHAKDKHMKSLYRDKMALTPQVDKLIEKVIKQCNICKKYDKSNPKPKVALPKATSFNETVSIDVILCYH